MVMTAAAAAATASPSHARAEVEPEPSPALLTQALSCQSREALGSFGELLFLQDRPPAWMRPSALPEALEGMIGLYGFALKADVRLFGEPVGHVYFMDDWVVALLPRATAERIVRAQDMQRAPVAATEQYYRFVDPEQGPMIGAFAPTGDALANVLAGAFGGSAASQPHGALPPPKPDVLLVGCNYAVASEEDFLAAARGAGETLRKVGDDLRRMIGESEGRPAG